MTLRFRPTWSLAAIILIDFLLITYDLALWSLNCVGAVR